MAYPDICDPCLDGRHDECLETFNKPPPGMMGGAICMCAHGKPENEFQRIVRERAEQRRREQKEEKQ